MMRITVEPGRFTRLPLIIKASDENDYSVMIDGLRAGRIMLRPVANSSARWFWSVTGPVMVQPGLGSSGEAETLDGAKLAFREAFDRWLEWALAADVAVHWNE